MRAVKAIVSLIVLVLMFQPVWGWGTVAPTILVPALVDEPAYDSALTRLIAFYLGMPLFIGMMGTMIGVMTPCLPRACLFSLCCCCACFPFCCIPGAIGGLIRGAASALGGAYVEALPGTCASFLGGWGPWSLCPDVGMGVAVTPAMMMCCPMLLGPCGHIAGCLGKPCAVVCPLFYCLSAFCLFHLLTVGSVVGITTLGSLMPHTFSKPEPSSTAHTSSKPDLSLPKELDDYYWDTRAKNLLAWSVYAMQALPSVEHWELFVPAGEMAILRDMIRHDSGEIEIPTSDIAAQYLREVVIEPLKETRSVKLQTGEWVSFEDQPTDLEIAQLLYYYARDSIQYPHIDETTSLERYVQQFPGGGLLARYYKRQRSIPKAERFCNSFIMLPYLFRFPTEAVATGDGSCIGKSLLLAALLEMEGFDVALGTFLMDALITQTDPSLFLYRPSSYHVYVLLRDPGWGIGHWEIEEDDFGREMGGEWIILDATRSPRHLPHLTMPGEKVLEFGDDPAWFALLDRDITVPGKPVFITLV